MFILDSRVLVIPYGESSIRQPKLLPAEANAKQSNRPRQAKQPSAPSKVDLKYIPTYLVIHK